MSKPVFGGHYRIDLESPPRGAVGMSLVVANDGGEFARPSWIAADQDCGKYTNREYFTLDDSGGRPYVATPISASARFAVSKTHAWARGSFTASGRAVVGAVAISADGSCRALRARFRAPLVWRPKAAPDIHRPASCDDVYVSEDSSYQLETQDVGCTIARKLVRSYAHAAQCRGLVLGRSCTTRQAVCRAVRGGGFNPLASASCRPRGQRRGLAETAYRGWCGEAPVTWPYLLDDMRRELWAINTSCKAAADYPLLELLIGVPDAENHRLVPACQEPIRSDIQGRCPPFSGYRCTETWSVDGSAMLYWGRCTDNADPFRAFDYLLAVK